MLNQSEFCPSSQKRHLTRVLPQPERQPHIGTREAARAAIQSETAHEIAVMELLIELDRIGRIVREIERELSQWEASEARGGASTH